MTIPIDLYQASMDTIMEKVNGENQIPAPFNFVISNLKTVYIGYRIFKISRVHHRASEKRSEANPVIFGTSMMLLENINFIKQALTIALVTKCSIDLLMEYEKLGDDSEKFCDALRDNYPSYEHIPWEMNSKKTFDILSPSMYLNYKIFSQKYTRQITKTIRFSLAIFMQFFKIAMCHCDIYFLLSGDRRIRFEAYSEMGVQWETYYNKLQGNTLFLIEEVEKGQPMADAIFRKLGMEIDCAKVLQEIKIKAQIVQESSAFQAVSDTAKITANRFQADKDINFFTYKLEDLETRPAPEWTEYQFPPWGGGQINIKASKLS